MSSVHPVSPLAPAAEESSSLPGLPGRAAQAADLVRSALALLALAPQRLTARQRRHGLKFRKGAEPSIRAVGILSDEHGVVVPGKPTAEMRASLERAEALRSLRVVLVGMLSAVDEAIFVEQGDAYGTALTLYGMLKRVAHRHPQIRANLAPVVEFFSYRSPSALAERAQKTKTAAGEAAAP